MASGKVAISLLINNKNLKANQAWLMSRGLWYIKSELIQKI